MIRELYGGIDYGKIREIIREEVKAVGNNITLENLLLLEELDSLWGWKPGETGEVHKRFTEVFDLKVDQYKWTYLEPKEEVDVRFYSRYAFKYPYMFVELHRVTESWFGIGFENTGGIFAGGCWFEIYKDDAGWHPKFTVTPGYSKGVSLDIGDLYPELREKNAYRLWIKINRGWAELHIRDPLSASDWGLKAVVVFASRTDIAYGAYGEGKIVKDTKPYYVAVINSPIDFVQTALIEGKVKPGDIIKNLVIVDGDPTPPRAFTAHTGETKWPETSIDSGSLTSDPIPVNGYVNKTIYFMADQDGTLDIEIMTHSTLNWRLYDSISTTGGKLTVYKMTGDALLIRLKFTPASYPATINEAEVVLT